MTHHQHDLQKPLTAMLVPPGEGVFTLSHALCEREQLRRLIYGTIDVNSLWEEQLTKLEQASSPWVLGLPEDSGGGILRGANWGPLFLRLAYYQQDTHLKLTELGDVRVVPQLLADEYLNADIIQSCRDYLYNDANASYPVSPLSITFDIVSRLYQRFPQARLLGIGGDHAASFPFVKAKLLSASNLKRRMAVLHFDAHTDLLTQRMGVPVTFGSWVPSLLPLLEQPSLWVQIGIRQSGKDQAWWEKTLGVKQYWAKEIKARGIKKIAEAIIEHLSKQAVNGVYITVDIDCLDATEVSATGTPETGGLMSSEVIELIQRIGEAFPVEAADIMEFAPMVHHPQSFPQAEPDTTLRHILPIYNILCQILRDNSFNPDSSYDL